MNRLLMCLLLCAAAPAAAYAQASSPLAAGADALGRGANLEALSDLNQALSSPSLSPADQRTAYVLRGEANIGLGQLSAAIADCQRASSLDATYARAFNCVGLAYRGRGVFDQAETALTQAVTLAPTEAAPLVNRGALYNQESHYDLAIKDETAALAIDPRSPQALLERAAAHYARGEYDLAIADDGQAVQLGGSTALTARAYNDRGVAYAAAGQFGPSLSDLGQAQRLAANNAAVATNLATVSNWQSHGTAGVAPAPMAPPPQPAPQPAPPAPVQAPPPAPMPAQAAVASPDASGQLPPPAFNRPFLAPVADVQVPTHFCTAVDRNSFMQGQSLPAQQTANANVDKANAYQAYLNSLFRTYTADLAAGGRYVGAIKSEMDAYSAITADAFHKASALADVDTAVRATPVGGCGT